MSDRCICFRLLLALGVVFVSVPMTAQPNLDPDAEWRAKEIWRAKGLFNKGDLSPIDEAFARKDLRTLWAYFISASNHQLGRGRDQLEDVTVKASRTEDDIMAFNATVKAKAGDYLRQIPGHAKLFGDDIEAISEVPEVYPQRELRFMALGRLGSEESIQQLGRFLFDKRNPDKDSKKYYVTPPANDGFALLWFQIALGEKSPLGKDAHLPGGALIPPKKEVLRQWWLTSADAAPYRQGLLASGVALPPNYPALPETAKRPDDVTTRDSSAESVSDATGWGIGLVLLALVATSVWLAARQQAQKSRTTHSGH